MRPVTLIKPKQLKSNILASIPHSGMWLPDHISKQCNQKHLSTLRNTDWYLDILYDFLFDIGVPIVKANFSRYVIDPNRSLDIPIFGPYQKSAIYEHNTWGESIYITKPTRRDIENRIEAYYKPYHECLEAVIDDIQNMFGYVRLFDLHSFMGPIRNDVCIGDHNGMSCLPDLRDKVFENFQKEGFDVVVNRVFSGGYITRHYGSLANVDAIQVELRYTTYLECGELDKDLIPSFGSSKFYQTQEKLKKIFSKLSCVQG